MRVPYRYAAPWFGYWSYLSDRSMQRWRCMVEDVEDRRYGADKLISDVLQFWNDAAVGWCAAVRGSSTDLPCIFFLIHPQQQADCKEIDFFAPSCPQGEPEVAYLRPIFGGDPSQINESKCRVCLVPRRHSLVVHLENLWKKPEPDLKKGVYEGLIHIGEEPVALLAVKVADKHTLYMSEMDFVAAGSGDTEGLETPQEEAPKKRKKKVKRPPKK